MKLCKKCDRHYVDGVCYPCLVSQLRPTIVRQEKVIHKQSAEILDLRAALDAISATARAYYVTQAEVDRQAKSISEAAHADKGKGAG